MKFTKRETISGDGPKLFIRLKDGESIVGIPRGEVYEFKQKWVGNRSQVTTEDDPDGKSKFRINFVVQEDGNFVVKILEFGLMLYQQLADIADDYPITETKVKITRRGQGTDTVYNAIPIVKEPLPAKILKQIQSMDLNILEHKDKPVSNGHSPETIDDESDAIPF